MANEILVIDDNSDIRQLISGILKDRGFIVREAANFDQAMLEINKKLPDVAIVDVKLDKGDNDGIEILVHLKKINEDIPVIMISGHANVQMAVDSLKLAALFVKFINLSDEKGFCINSKAPSFNESTAICTLAWPDIIMTGTSSSIFFK